VKSDVAPPAFSVGDQFPHQPSTEEFWNESMLLYWYDDVAGAGGFHRIGYQPNRGAANYQCGVSTLDGQRFRRTAPRIDLGGTERREQGYRLDDFVEVCYGEAGTRWTAACEDFEMNLLCRDFLPRYDSAAIWRVDNEITRNMSSAHYEVPGRVTGEVRVGARRYSVSCLAYRDHSWGVRKWSVVSAYRWFTGNLGPDFSWTYAPTMGPDGSAFTAGYVYDCGHIERIARGDLVVLQELDGLSARGAQATLETPSGRRYQIELSAMDGITMEIEGHLSCFALGTMRVGERVGVGVCEVYNNVRQGKVRPPFLLGAAMENGLSSRRRVGTLW
jgi:hypothetical protein